MATSVLELLQRNQAKPDYQDVQVTRSWVDYQNGKMSHLLFEMQVRDGDGEYVTLYKAIKLYRLTRVPKSSKNLRSFMHIHGDLIAALYNAEINFVEVIANIRKPKAIGLFVCYGVQAVSGDSIEEAKEQADNDMSALLRVFGSAFRTIEIEPMNFEQMEWIRQKMQSMKHVQAVRGLPVPRNGVGRNENSTAQSAMGSSDTQETAEEFIIGMSDFEYIAVLMATPIDSDVLTKWLTVVSKDSSRWNSLLQGSKGMNFGLSMPMMYMANLGASNGWSSGTSEGVSDSHSDSTSLSHSMGTTEGTSQSFSSSVSEGNSMSQGQSASIGHSIGQSHGTTDGTSITDTTGTSHSTGISQSTSVSDSTGTSHSVSNGTSWSDGTSTGTSTSHSVGTSSSHSTSQGTSSSTGESHSNSSGTSLSHSDGSGTSDSYSQSYGSSDSTSKSQSNSVGGSIGGGIGPVKGSANYSHGWTSGETHGTSSSTGQNDGVSTSSSDGVGSSLSFSDGMSSSHGTSTSEGWSSGTSTTNTTGTSTSVSHSTGGSTSVSDGTSQTHTVGSSQGTSESWGTSQSHSVGQSHSESNSQSVSDSTSQGVSQSQGQSFSKSAGQSVGSSFSKSQSTSQGTGHSDGWGSSSSQNQGFSGALSTGSAGSMGIGPSLSWSKTFQWKDVEVENILMLLDFQRERLLKATNGQGAFFVDFYIATEDDKAHRTASAVATSAWFNENAYVSPLEVIDLERHEEEHLLYHMNAFSPCLMKEGIPGQLESYKFSTVLLSDELAAYSHPPRVSEGGLYAEVEDMPVLAVPSNRQDGEIYVGQILSAERYSPETGYVTPFQFRIRESELMHAFFAGGSRSGKTVTATRVVAEMANNVRRGPMKKRLRIIAMDPKQDWRILGKFVDPERFRFYSLADPDFLPVKLNLCKIPKNVWPERYMNSVVEIFCRSFGLGERGKQILTRAFFEEYTKAGCFRDDWRKHATERSASVTMATIYDNLARKREEMDDPKGKVKYGNDARDAFTRVMDRMEAFGRVGAIAHTVFCDPSGQGIDELLGKDDVVVLESYGLESTTRSFVFGLITSAIYQYCVHNGGFVKPEDQYETVLIIEEANEVLLGQDSADGSSGGGLSGPSEFERILDQSAGNGLFIWAITQKISLMPTSIIANCGIVFAGRQKIPEDIIVCVRQFGREEKFDDRPLVKWFPRCPTGWFTIQTSRTMDFKDAEPVMVKVEPLTVVPPSNEELVQMMKMREVELLRRSV